MSDGTSKFLPRDPTPEMVEAAIAAVGGDIGPLAARAIHRAAWDAYPASLPLKRTPCPTEPGWYWAVDHLGASKNPMPVFLGEDLGKPVVIVPGEIALLSPKSFDWFGEIFLPEVER